MLQIFFISSIKHIWLCEFFSHSKSHLEIWRFVSSNALITVYKFYAHRYHRNYITLVVYLSLFEKKKTTFALESGPFSAGYGSRNSEFLKPDTDPDLDPTCTNLESIQTSTFFISIRILQIFSCWFFYLKKLKTLLEI